MTVHQRILQVLSILLVVLAVCELAGGALLAVVGVLGIENADIFASVSTAELQELDISVSDAAFLILVFGVLMALGGLITLPVGLLGKRGAKNPAKIMPFIVLNIIILVLNVGLVIAEVVGGSLEYSLEAVTTALIPIFFQGLSLYCAITVKRMHAQGKIVVDEKALQPGLGFIRVVQVLFGLNILITLVSSMMLISGNYTLGPTEILAYVNLVLDGVAFWFITQRSKATRWWIIGTGILNITAGTGISLMSGDFDLVERIASSSLDIVLVLYFWLAKKPKTLLVNEFSLARQKEMVIESWDLWQPKSWDFWRAMIIYYCVFSIVGHWMEAGFCLFIKWGFIPGIYDPSSGIWHDYLNPFPVYGFGMVACAVLLFPIKTKLQETLGGVWKPLLLSFIINTLVCSGIELTLGLTQNMPDANGVYPLWDYSTMPFNFMGQICLQNSLAFGIVATLMAWVVFPALQKVYLKLPLDVKNTLFVALLAFYALVECLYVINI